MKKKLKNFIVSLILIIPLMLCGCANPFTASNSIGNNNNTEVDFTPEQENPGSVENTGGDNVGEDEVDPNAGLYYDPTNDEEDLYATITDSFTNTKFVYKPESNTNIEDVSKFLYNSSDMDSSIDLPTAFLNRVIAEYGVGTVDYDSLMTGNPLTGRTISPFNAVISDTLVRAGLVSDAEKSNYNDTVLTQLVSDIRNKEIYYKVKIDGSELQYLLMSDSTCDLTAGVEGLPINITYNAGVYTLNTTEQIETLKLYTPYNYINNGEPTWQSILTNTTCTITPGFYYVKSGDNVFIVSFGQTFLDNVENNLMMVLDSHEDAIRYNIENISANPEQNNITPYTVSYIAWNKSLQKDDTSVEGSFVAEYIETYGASLAVDFASVLLFGLNDTYGIDFPDVEVSYGGFTGKIVDFYNSASGDPQRYINFCATYIDHVGLTNYETDMLSEFFLHNYIGDAVLALDNARFTHMTDNEVKEGEIKTFNSNEAVLNNLGEIAKYRKLIINYDNISTRADSKNNVFDSINYKVVSGADTAVSEDITNSTSFIKYDTRYDSRSTLFKNYTNTVYASLNFIKSDTAAGLDYSVDIDVDVLNVRTDYLMNVSFNNDYDENGNIFIREEETTEDDSSGDDEDMGDEDLEGEGEEELNENKILDRELCGKVQSIVLMPNEAVEIHYIELLVEPDLELLDYKAGEKIIVRPIMRYCRNGEVYTCTNILINGAGEAELYALYDEEDKAYMADPINLVYGSGDFFKFYDEDGNLAEDITCITLNPFIDNEPTDIRFSNILSANKVSAHNINHFAVSSFANDKGVNYVYNDTSTDFVEISFMVSVDGSNFANSYGLGISISDIYGKVL